MSTAVGAAGAPVTGAGIGWGRGVVGTHAAVADSPIAALSVADTGEAGGGGEVTDAPIGFAVGLGATGDGVRVFEDAGVFPTRLTAVAVVVLGTGDTLAADCFTYKIGVAVIVQGTSEAGATGSVALTGLSERTMIVGEALHAFAKNKIAELSGGAIVVHFAWP